MKTIYKYILISQLLILPTLLLAIPNAAGHKSSSTDELLGFNAEGKHNIRIELSQWEIKAFDISDRPPGQDGAYEEEFIHRVGKFERGATVVFEVVTRDVQHGFSVNALDVSVASIRPTQGDDGEFQTFGDPTIVEAQLPDEDVTLSAFCSIFCGLGHPDMKLKLVVGEGSFESGPLVYNAAIAINVLIFGLVSYMIWNKRNKVIE